mmetsp:Transcript_54837/g.175828  ORF Transcript_54837/g.175828 Transcript_54837/m.175828 type:complete len:230 (-) Transcript_54837:216-905(-)
MVVGYVHDAHQLDDAEEYAEAHQDKHLQVRVAGEDVLRLLALGVRQRAANGKAQALHDTPGGRQAHDVVLGLRGLLVPRLLSLVLPAVACQGHGLPDELRDAAQQVDDHPRQGKDCKGRHGAPRNLRLQHCEAVDGSKPRDVPQQDAAGLQVQHPPVFLQVLPNAWQTPGQVRKRRLQHHEPQEEVHHAYEELEGLRRALQKEALDKAVYRLEEEHGGEDGDGAADDHP